MRAEGPRPAFGAGDLPRESTARWTAAIPRRRARRSYTGQPIAPGDLDALAALTDHWRPWRGARAVLLRDAPASVFAGIVGAYGGVSHSPSALVFIGDARVGSETVGYTGEALVLEATARGLGTCWVAGLFRAGVIGRLLPVADDEHIYAVSALGVAVPEPSTKERVLFGAGHPKARRSLDEIAPGHETWPGWARAAAEAARVAPSAVNRQPWRFALEGDTLTVSFAGRDVTRIPKRLDCGIAMLHAELGALGEGVVGRWELLESPRVARFVAAGGGDYQPTAATPAGARASSEMASLSQVERQIPQP